MLVRYQETKEAVEQYRNQLEEERAEQEVMQLEYEAQQDNLESHHCQHADGNRQL